MSRLALRTFSARLLLLCALGAVLRIAVAYAAWPLELHGDEHSYRRVAIELATTGRHFDPNLNAVSQWPPANAAWLSLWLDGDRPRDELMGSQSLARLIAAQLLLGSLLPLAFGLFAREIGDDETALLATTLVAVHPTLVGFSHVLWAATPLLLLLYASLALGTISHRKQSAAWALAAGLGFGLATLTREIGLLVGTAVAIGWIARSPGTARRAATLRALLLVVSMAAVVAPWTARNYLEHDRLVAVSTIGWMSLRIGNTLGDPDWFAADRSALAAFHQRFFAEHDEIERMDLARGEALAIIAAEQPSWLLKKIVRNGAHLFSLDNPLLSKLEQGRYGAPDRAAVRAVIVVLSLFSILGCVGALAGLVIERNPQRALLLGSLAACVIALHVLANAAGRYVVPLIPVLAYYCGLALRAPRREFQQAERWRWGLAACVLCFYLFVSVPYEFDDTVGQLWRAGVSDVGATQ